MDVLDLEDTKFFKGYYAQLPQETRSPGNKR